MGYTHYYYVAPQLHQRRFSKVTKDFKKLLPWFDSLGINLKGPFGEDSPIITDDMIQFNGNRHCGHETKDLGITWPSRTAKGVGNNQMYKLKYWFGGRELQTRECDGDCSHETFTIEREFDTSGFTQQERGKYFNFCKTAYKPYDLAVTACLVIAKHHLKTQIRVCSDGEPQHWQDAILLCQNVLGYGSDFTLSD